MKCAGFLSLLLMLSSLSAWGSDELMTELRTRFAPNKATIELHYDITYRFLFLELMTVARAEILTTEGFWKPENGAEPIPVYFIEGRIDTLEKPEEKDASHLSLHDRMITVLTRPQIDTLLYYRRADQVMKPFIGRKAVNRHFEMYNLESGKMKFQHVDLTTGHSTTNLEGEAALARQGKEIAELLQLLSNVYLEKTPLLSFETSPRVYIDIERHIQPFAVQTKHEKAPLAFKPELPTALRADIYPAKEATRKLGHMSVWILSMADMARSISDEQLTEVSGQSPDWSIVPLVADYDLKLGYIRGSLSAVKIRH